MTSRTGGLNQVHQTGKGESAWPRATWTVRESGYLRTWIIWIASLRGMQPRYCWEGKEGYGGVFYALQSRINSPFPSPFLTPVDVTWEIGLQYRIGSFLDRKGNRIFHQNIRIYNG